MIPDFKGHHFREEYKPNEPPSGHYCDRCGLKLRSGQMVQYTLILSEAAYFSEQATPCALTRPAYRTATPSALVRRSLPGPRSHSIPLRSN
jgi:hypothetical protein